MLLSRIACVGGAFGVTAPCCLLLVVVLIPAPCSEYGPPLKACIVAVQVAADVGLGRWVKLLNARSTAHTRLKQYELKQILDLSEQVGLAQWPPCRQPAYSRHGCTAWSAYRLCEACTAESHASVVPADTC